MFFNIQTEGCPLENGQTNQFGTCNATELCNNTYKTCKSRCDFICVIQIEQHTDCNTTEFPFYTPSICSYPRYQSGRVDLCAGLQSSGKASIQVQDFENKDIEAGYLDRRDSVQGTSWAKWKKRNTWENRLAQIEHGFCGAQYPEDFITRDFFIDDIDGPSSDCKYTFELKDSFSLLNNDDAKWPLDRTTTSTTSLVPASNLITLIAADGFDQNTEALCINGEVIRVQFAGMTTVFGGDRVIYTILERGVCNSERNTESVQFGTSVSLAKRYEKGTHLAKILFDSLHRDGDGLPFVDSDDCECGPFTKCVIDKGSFDAVINDPCYSYLTVDETYLCEPEGLKTLVRELAQFLLQPYLDDCDQKIKLDVFEPIRCGNYDDLPLFVERWMIKCNVDVSPKRDSRVSNVCMFGDPFDCAKGLDDDNIELLYKTFGPQGLGSACNNPAWRGGKLKELKNRFIRGCNKYLAEVVANRIYYLFLEDVEEVKFQYPASLMPVGLRKFQQILVNHKKLQDEDGNDTTDIYYINNITQSAANCYEITATTSSFKTTDIWADSIDCDGECPMVVCEGDDCSQIEGPKLW